MKLNVAMFNCHASGTSKMMKAVKQATTEEAIKLNTTQPKILAVTILTSISVLTASTELCLAHSIPEQVLTLTHLAKNNGMDGVICSAMEAKMIRKEFKDLLLITPSIRMPNDVVPNDDQARKMTPKEASDLVDYMVIGRPILLAANPEEKIAEILA